MDFPEGTHLDRFLIPAAALLVAATAARADEAPPPAEPALSLTVAADKSYQEEPQSIGVLTREALQRNEGLFLDDTINLIPGVRLESRTVSGGQRITIRGYGNGTNFNGTGYKAYLNGIPLTDAEGTTILDDIDISTLGRVEVIKGPASSLYGSGIGGVVRFNTLTPERTGARASQELIGGSNRLFRSNTRVENGSQNSTLLLNYGHQHSDGYRVHSLSNKDNVLLSGDYRASARQAVTYYAAFNHSFDQLAGQLTDEQFKNRENVAEAPYLANNGHVAVDSLRFGVAHRYDLFSALSNTTTIFGSGYQVNQPFAVGLTDNLTLNAGGRTEFTLRAGRFTGIVGSELQNGSSFKKSYGLTNSVLGGIRGDLQVVALQSNTFAQVEAALPAEFKATAGASLNFVRYNIKDRLTNTANPTHADQSGVKKFDPVITPRVAVEKSFGNSVAVYAQLSQGYSAPGSGSVVIAQIGQVNENLKPERGTLIEAGSKGSLLDDRASYEVAVFQLGVSDKLTSQAVTSPTGTTLYTITTNAGSQTNRGVEVAGRYAFIKDENAALSLAQAFVAYTYSNFKYDGFKSDANNNAKTIDYTGNKVVGVPDHMLDVGLDLGTRFGAYANATLQHMGMMPLTFDNTQKARDYTLVNCKLGYRRELPAGFRLDASAGLKNLFDSTYYTMAFLNSNYSGPPPNVYLPGPGRNVYAGLTLSKAL